MIIVRRKIGDTEIEFHADGKDIKEAILRSTWLTEAPTVCGLCAADTIYLRARVTKEGEFLYAEYVCKNCGGKAPLGEFKNPKGALFVKKWEEKWEKQSQAAE